MDQSSTLRAHGALFSRLRNALGLSSLAALTMGSSCGPCPDESEYCLTRTELSNIRERALGSQAGAAGAAGVAGSSGRGGTGGSAPTEEEDRALVETWDPAGTCPTTDQYRAMARLATGSDRDVTKLSVDSPTECCYVSPKGGPCPGGRPFLVDGEARVAALEGERGLYSVLADQSAFQRALARSFAADGLSEHASVAAFARLTLRLLSFAAPAAFVEGAQRASLDELRHAEICFRHASQHAGRVLAPGALPLHGALEEQSFAEFVRENLLEGCIGETLAAIRMGEQARAAEDPELAAELAGIAEDETRHAELAFCILRWCSEREPEVTANVLRQVLDSFRHAAVIEAATPDPRWARAGRLTPAEAATLDRLTLETLLLPLFGEVLGDARVASDQGLPRHYRHA